MSSGGSAHRAGIHEKAEHHLCRLVRTIHFKQLDKFNECIVGKIELVDRTKQSTWQFKMLSTGNTAVGGLRL
jgi:hypothetical protein